MAPVPERILESLEEISKELDDASTTHREWRPTADRLRQNLAVLESLTTSIPQPPRSAPMDRFFDALEARAREKKPFDYDLLADLLRDDEED